MNRCAARGCGRWARAGEMFCSRHEDRLAAGDVEAARRAAPEGLAPFQERVAAGNYAALLGPGLRETLWDAAAAAGLEAEIGALRLALVRLLQEERDPSRMAAGMARVAGVLLQAARLRQDATGGVEEMRGALLQELAAIEAERAAGAGMAERGGEWE